MGPNKLSNRNLLKACLEKDDDAHWNEFVERVQPAMASVIIKTLHNPIPDRVDEFIQRTYVKLFDDNRRALRSLRLEHEKSLFSFVKMVALNVVRDGLRDGEEDETEELKPEHEVSESAEEQMIHKRRIDEIDERLRKVAAGPNCARDCTIFWLYYKVGLTAKEISLLPTIDLTVKGVEATLLRLARLLRGGMQGHAGGAT